MIRSRLSPLHRRQKDDVVNERLRQQQREQARAKRRAEHKAIYAKPERRDLYISPETEEWFTWIWGIARVVGPFTIAIIAITVVIGAVFMGIA